LNIKTTGAESFMKSNSNRISISGLNDSKLNKIFKSNSGEGELSSVEN